MRRLGILLGGLVLTACGTEASRPRRIRSGRTPDGRPLRMAR